MANQPPPYPPPPGPQYPPPQGDWRYQRRVLKEQARIQRDIFRAQRDAYRAQLRGSRRSSIVGPLLLIAVGVIFFLIQTGHMSMRFFWDWYGRYWPLLLIGVGVIMLLEWGWDQYFHSGEPIRRRSLGGGVFVLLILLGITGIFFSGFHNGAFGRSFNLNPDNMDEFLGDKHESDQTLTQAFTAGNTLTIDNPRGDINVSGISDDNQVHIEVHKQVYTRSDSEADSKAQQLSPKVDAEGSNVRITLPSIEGGRADLTITVPAEAPVTVVSNRGDVRVASVKAPVIVTANHGDVTFTAITGPAKARINNGDSSFSAHSVTGPVAIEGRARDLAFSEINGSASMDGEFFGTTHLQHITDNIRFHTSRTDLRLARLDGEIDISPNADLNADQALGPLTLATRNRNITLERVAGDVSVTNRNGSVELTAAPPLGNITVENRNGSVNITLPEPAGFTVQAETTNGDLENDFSLNQQGSDDSNRKSYNGTVGKGGPLVRVNTSQGDITLKKASVAPLPPTPPAPPKISIRSGDGSSVYVGKEGVNITGEDGTHVIVDKNGVRINANPDGSSVYVNKGTRLTTNADGSRVYIGADGTRYTSNADGSKIYKGRDGTTITINADGTRVSHGPNGHALSNSEMDDRIAQAARDADKAAADRDAQRAARNR
jgi:DUF4097 and DUF4098 domain-containing protein YvlB